MRPQKQTIFHNGTTKGNCLAANIASLLNIDIASVPNFVEDIYWEHALNRFLEDYRLCYFETPITGALKHEVIVTACYHLIHGPSPRGDFWHSVIGKGGLIVHDPHPDNTGLKEEKNYVFLVRI